MKFKNFKHFCITIGNIPSSYVDSMSYYELLMWYCNFLEEKVIPAIDNNAEAVKEIQEWIKNIDIKEEVENKLDKMAQDGTLSTLIGSYLENKFKKAIVSYNNIEEMVNDETIEEGQTLYIKGEKNINDGFSAYYNIVNDSVENGLYSIKLNNNLYAVMQNKIEENFYNEIYYKTFRHDSTDCYMTYIPYKDSNDEQIDFVVVPTGTNPLNGTDFTPNEHAIYNNTSFTSNASLAVPYGGGYVDGSVISEGVIIRDYSLAGIVTDEYKYIGIKADRTIQEYQANSTPAQTMFNDGVKNAVLCFGTCVENGELVENFEHYQKPDVDQFLGVKDNKDIVILTCDGRNSSNKGLTYITGGQLLIDEGCVTVYCLDSGGSASTSINGVKINMDVDDYQTSDRKIAYLFDVKKTITNKTTADIVSSLGTLKQNISDQLIRLINKREPLILKSKYRISQQNVTSIPGGAGPVITSYTLSTPSTSIFSIENGIIKLNLPDTYLSNLPFDIRIHGHILMHNTTNTNTSHYINLLEDNNIDSVYRITIGPDDWATFNIDEIMHSASGVHEYKLCANLGINNTTQVYSGTLYLEFIPKITTFI